MRLTLDVQQQKLAFLLELLNNFDFVQVEEATQQDWWDELPQSVKDGYAEGMKDIEEGNLIPMEEAMKKYR
ncbi:MAG: hypothetical protein GY810_03595 [Aureispira sp.]|nr:hypothetical protein [Aureispira sp.]